jgi:hypothetical protein
LEERRGREGYLPTFSDFTDTDVNFVEILLCRGRKLFFGLGFHRFDCSKTIIRNIF